MERLTHIDHLGWYINRRDGGRIRGSHIDRLAAYENTGLEPEEIKAHEEVKYSAGYYDGDESRCRWIEKELGPISYLRDLLQAEQDGRLVVLPCKVGDTVYFTLLGRIIEKQVFSIVSFSSSTRIYCAGTSKFFRPEEIGKTVFLTREEAEAALAGKGISE